VQVSVKLARREQRIRHRIGLANSLLGIPNVRQTDFSGDPYRLNR
jgi:hypothetical protein